MGDSFYWGALIALALEYCKACPVQYQCARYALHTAPSSGYIWGTWGAAIGICAGSSSTAGRTWWTPPRGHGEPVQVALRVARRVRRVHRPPDMYVGSLLGSNGTRWTG